MKKIPVSKGRTDSKALVQRIREVGLTTKENAEYMLRVVTEAMALELEEGRDINMGRIGKTIFKYRKARKQGRQSHPQPAMICVRLQPHRNFQRGAQEKWMKMFGEVGEGSRKDAETQS